MVKGFVVALEQDISEEDAEQLRRAILLMKGISGVTASEVNSEDWLNRQRVGMKITQRILGVLKEEV